MSDRPILALAVMCLLEGGTACNSDTKDAPDDYRRVCAAVDEVGRDYRSNDVDSPLAYIAAAAPAGSAIRAAALQMARLDTSVESDAEELVRLSQELDAELRDVCS